jgi:hypothetical protein
MVPELVTVTLLVSIFIAGEPAEPEPPGDPTAEPVVGCGLAPAPPPPPEPPAPDIVPAFCMIKLPPKPEGTVSPMFPVPKPLPPIDTPLGIVNNLVSLPW